MFIEHVILPLVVCTILFVIIYAIILKYKKEEEENIDVKPGILGRKPIKKALIVGINKYKPELNADLQGCVNDAENMRDILTKIYKFDPENIRVVIDERATRKGILDRLKWLLDGAIPGDELVFHYSGHGSQVRDRNGDELNDKLDEILCPHDLNWDNPLTDDILASMIGKLNKKVNFTMICDSCHSGTMTRGRIGNPHAEKPRFIMPPFDIRSRSMGKKLPKHKIGKLSKIKNKKGNQNHVLISGCRDDQTSADAFIGNIYQGAFTWALTSVIKSDPNLTWREAHTKAVKKLSGYTQVPQLSGDESLLTRKLFGGTD
jgi:hypothetical protein